MSPPAAAVIVTWVHTLSLVQAPGANLPIDFEPPLETAPDNLVQALDTTGAFKDAFKSLKKEKEDMFPLFYALVMFGRAAEVKWIVGDKKRRKLCDVTRGDSIALMAAVMYNQTALVPILIEEGKLDAKSGNSRALNLAADYHNTDLVRLFLRHGADPSSDASYALRIAARSGWDDIVRILLFECPLSKGVPCVDPSANGEHALCDAVDYGHLNIVKMLCEQKIQQLDASINKNQPLRHAVGRRNLPITEYLLSLPPEFHVDPAADDQSPLSTAALNGDADIVRVLLRHPRVDPSYMNNMALKNAEGKNHTEVIHLLRNHLGLD